MPNFAPSRRDSFAARMEDAISAAVQRKRAGEPPRDYLGGSLLGRACDRELGFQWFQVATDPDRGFSGRTYRIFDHGHDAEDRVAEYLLLAGFDLRTQKEGGGQWGFGLLKTEENPLGMIRGHADGVIVAVPPELEEYMPELPALWENKSLNDTRWKAVARGGVREAEWEYYVQVQVYMACLAVLRRDPRPPAPALWTAINKNTQEIYSELIPFHEATARHALQRAEAVVTAARVEDLPRIAREPTDFRCRFCDWQAQCWGKIPMAAPKRLSPVAAPATNADEPGPGHRSPFEQVQQARPATNASKSPWGFGYG